MFGEFPEESVTGVQQVSTEGGSGFNTVHPKLKRDVSLLEFTVLHCTSKNMTVKLLAQNRTVLDMLSKIIYVCSDFRFIFEVWLRGGVGGVTLKM